MFPRFSLARAPGTGLAIQSGLALTPRVIPNFGTATRAAGEPLMTS